MAIIKKNELKNMNEKQISDKIEDLKKELIKINAQISTGTSPENPGNVREIKKTIARLLTKLNEKSKEAKKKE